MDPQTSYASLVNGIESLDVTGDFSPCQLLLTGDRAFPVLVDSKDEVLIAASQYGDGRMVVFAHEAMLTLPQLLPLIKNALEWMKPSLTAQVWVEESLSGLSEMLLSNGFQVNTGAPVGDSLGIYCLEAYNDEQAKGLVRFVRRGGGLLIGGQAWNWSYKHGKENVLVEFPGNRVTSVAGVYFTADVGENGIFPVPTEMPRVPRIDEATSTLIFPNHPQDFYASLVKDIQSLDVTGDFRPCQLLLTGDRAFPVLLDSKDEVLIAASQYRDGRMVVFAHEAMLTLPQLLPLIKNALEWMKPSSTAQVWVEESLSGLSEMLLSNGFQVNTGAPVGDALGIYCLEAYSDEQAEDLIWFVRRGGGLLIGGQAWNWSSKHGKENVLMEFPGNQVTSVAGVYFTGNMGENGIFPVPPEMPRVPLITESGLDIQRDLNSLLNGVTQFDMYDKIPSPLLIHGNLAFPVAVSDSDETFIGAAYYGRGRVVVASHEGLLNTDSMQTFLLNAIRWLMAGKGGKVGVGSDFYGVHSMLLQAMIPCELTSLQEGLSVYCCSAYSDDEMENIHEFVSEGGGLLIGAQAWSWTYSHPNSSAIAQFPGNKILNKFGIGIVGKAIDYSNEIFPAKQPGDESLNYNFRKMLSHFKEQVENDQPLHPPYSLWCKKLAQDSAAFLQIPAAKSSVFSSVHKHMVELVQHCGIPDIDANNPIDSNSDKAVLFYLSWDLYNAVPEFQSLVPSLNQHFTKHFPVETQTMWINATNNGKEAWRSTGMYVPPAKTATVVFSSTVLDANLQVQIGCHSDDLSNADQLQRPPVMVRRFQVKNARVEVSSLWGGLLYIIVPENSSLGSISITIEDATAAPYFRHGETSVYAWQNDIRHYASPWAELETENIILTVPSDDARKIDDPENLLTTWAQMMNAITELAAIPPVFPRPERIVTDVQIAAGWMHSGYPVMSNIGAMQSIVDMNTIQTEGCWGPIHELGHNQQQSGWEFPPHTTEATCNLWSVYVNETVLNIPRDKAHSDLQPDLRKQRIEDYLQKGAQLKDFEVFTALEPYLQLQEAFGWDAYKRIFAEYQRMTNIPSDNKSKMNLWAETFSQTVHKNLAPFFKVWGWPIEDEVSWKLANAFPPWEEDPMK
ncbi:TRPM8 channel-associated factor homolog [Anolis carolinensis]|uniref:TRPM8 channel-associated factor homolog n=1 Tax=Anolis carolinensis TaxID=28377 RepID=UPI002F2B3E27